jgi:L-ascorbate metabolism protein UlaG (beta-lactamase superfamily)
VGDELMPCFFKGIKQKDMGLKCEDVTPEKIDAIVLTQFFQDHMHPPTMKKIDKNVRVIGNKTALWFCERMGFKNLELMKVGSEMEINTIKITTFLGCRVGPL